ncbi:MAG: non-canonical purine NTP pyrophosphatase [Gemmatimonadota bacterium]
MRSCGPRSDLKGEAETPEASRRGGRRAEPRSPEEKRPPRGRRILVATRSADKLNELRGLLGGKGLALVSLTDIGVRPGAEEASIEVFDSFAENARAKARHFHARTGLPTLADDSGLCVAALRGAPGVRSRRFAPDEWSERLGRDAANNAYLLERLEGVPADRRAAHYRCALVLVDGSRTAVAEGVVHGRIAEEPRGEGGFGYDPLFVVPEYGKTFGELPPEVKARLSHRARAARALRAEL